MPDDVAHARVSSTLVKLGATVLSTSLHTCLLYQTSEKDVNALVAEFGESATTLSIDSFCKVNPNVVLNRWPFHEHSTRLGFVGLFVCLQAITAANPNKKQKASESAAVGVSKDALPLSILQRVHLAVVVAKPFAEFDWTK